MDVLQNLVVPIVAILVLIGFIGFVLARLYQRATREVSLVKTGSGGLKVVMDGGTLVIPLLHEISLVNMKTLRLEVNRVNATEDGIARAAQTLGDRTFDVNELREMIEGKLVDGLRSVAAKMTMDDLHENRSDFVQEVQNAVSEDLLKNGLELESVSLTALDQTPFEHLDENNAFNAVGMRQLAEVIANSKKKRALIDAEADTAVRQAAMEAAKRKLDIDREEQEAGIVQVQVVETKRAAQEAEIASRRQDAEREAEQARILKERQVRASEIEREEAIRSAEIAKERQIEVADQERQIIVATKSEEESRARASADTARAEAAEAAEAVKAEREAERQATGIKVSAAAEKAAAADRAEAVREEATAEANALTIKAEAKKTDKLAEAEGTRALVDAENAISTEIAAMKVQLARLAALPKIVAEMVKPAEKIGSIKIHHISGLNGATGGSGEAVAANSGGSPITQAVDAIGSMAVQLPALKKLGEEVGISLDGGVSGLMEQHRAESAPANDPPRVEQNEATIEDYKNSF